MIVRLAPPELHNRPAEVSHVVHYKVGLVNGLLSEKITKHGQIFFFALDHVRVNLFAVPNHLFSSMCL